MAIATGTALALGAAATVAGGVMSSRASSGAARTQASAARNASIQQEQMAREAIKAQRDTLTAQLENANESSAAQIRAQIASLDNQIAIYDDVLAKQLGVAGETRDKQLETYKPYSEAGLAGQNQLMNYLGIGGGGGQGYGQFATAEFTPEAFAAGQDPGYAFRMREGLKAVDAQAAARGGLISGAALKASQRFGQDMASQEYQNAFNRFQTTRANTLAPYQQLQGVGLTTAGQMANVLDAYGTRATGAYGAYGAAAGGAQSAYGNNISNIYGTRGSMINSALGNYGNQVTGALTGYGNAASSNMLAAGNAQAAGQVGSANAINQGISGVTNMYYQNQMLGLLGNRNNSSIYNNSPYNDLQDPGGIGY
jgi:hypothetical protein